MRKKDFEPITIESVSRMKQLVNIDKTLAMIDTLRILPEITQTRRLSLCLFAGVCTSGFASITVNDKKRTAEKNTVMFITDESVINDLRCSDDFDGFGFFISYQLLQEILREVTNMSDLFLLTHNHPVFTINDEELKYVKSAFNGMRERISRSDYPNRKEIARLHILTMLYDISKAFRRVLRRNDDNSSISDKQNRSELIFVQFVQHVEKHFREQRQVQWYANLMDISPKYLCEVVTAVSQRSPNDWIDRFVIAEIRNQLRHTTKKVSEIAKDMSFPTQSFFGKYFKDNVGISPTDYRNGLDK